MTDFNRLPEKIKVGYADATVESISRKMLTDLDEHICGKYFSADHKILIADDLSRHNTVNTLIHEVFHAIAVIFNITMNDEVEESVVNGFSNGVCSLLRDEPKFFLWSLSEMLDPDEYIELLEEELHEVRGDKKPVGKRRKSRRT